MQRAPEAEVRPVMEQVKTTAVILTWSAGLILAGSDGPMMPYVNVLGAILFAMASFWLAGRARKPGHKALKSMRPAGGRAFRAARRPEICIRTKAETMSAGKVRSFAVRPRYARDLGVV